MTFSRFDTVNLDVSAVMAYVSEVSNGGADYDYMTAPLIAQALYERQSPVLPFIRDVIRGISFCMFQGH